MMSSSVGLLLLNSVELRFNVYKSSDELLNQLLLCEAKVVANTEVCTYNVKAGVQK